jgi:N-acetylglucosamine-6-phosphate deacetylase
MPRTLIHSALVVTDGLVRQDGWVLFDGKTIAATGQGRPPAADLGLTSRTQIVDGRGRFLTPGFIDIHCHGGGGASFSDGAPAIAAALDVHRAHGTTRSVLSLATATIEDLEGQLDTVAAISARDPLVLGSHLEGPFLSRSHKGAHDATLLRRPDPSSMSRLLDAGAGTIRQITLAPELPGGMEAVTRFVEADVAVAIGHTDVSYQGACAAFGAGATILTHAFNGMNGMHPRAPGPVLAAIRCAGITLEVINDGVHVDHEMVALACNEAPGRVALITDAMAAACSPDGEYMLGTLRVLVRDRVARLADGYSIAGSTLTLDAALRQAVESVRLPVQTAVAALTQVPARVIGRSHDLGRLAVGYAADAVLLDETLHINAVWAGGQRLRAASPGQ